MKTAIYKLTSVSKYALQEHLIPGLRRHAVSAGLLLVLAPAVLGVGLALRATNNRTFRTLLRTFGGRREEDAYYVF